MTDDAVFDDPHVAALLELALSEDVGAGDRTSQALVPPTARGRGRLLAKAPIVLAGLPLLERVFAAIGAGVTVRRRVHDGAHLTAGTVAAEAYGPARTLLAGERLALNLLQHLSGIATLTAACVARVQGTRLVIRDTRKTVPGLRLLAKYAVRCGGGTNHRRGLDDAILVKDNHLALFHGDLAAAVRAARTAFPTLPLEIEVRTLDELRAALPSRPDLILLDNMSIALIEQAVQIAAGQVPLEASGGITLGDLPAVAATGVDYVAMGQLTHSAGAADLSLKIQPVTD